MTEPDLRLIAPDDDRYNATLIGRSDETDSLTYVTVKFDGPGVPFESGQYMTIGVMADGRLVQRPYSVASDPGVCDSQGYELYVRLVQGGLFTPLLWQLPVGHRMRMIGPKGKFTLQPDDDRTHLFISSGTGNAPFVSMMRMLIRLGQPRKAIFLNGVSYQHELGYRGLVNGVDRAGAYPVTYIPTVSRPDAPENARLDGPLGSRGGDRGAGLRGAGAHAREHDRLHLRQPGHDPVGGGDAPGRGFPEDQVKKELYWPKGKGPTGGRHFDRRVAAAVSPGRLPSDPGSPASRPRRGSAPGSSSRDRGR